MSMCLYMRNVMLADRLCINENDDCVRLGDMQKLHVSACQRFAFSYCGSKLLRAQLWEMETYLAGILTMAIATKKPYSLHPEDDARDHAHSLFKNQHVMLMTRDAVYDRDPKYSGVFVRVENTDVIVNGTFGNAVYTALMITEYIHPETPLTVEKMCEVASDAIEYISGRRAPTINHVCQSSLLPFVAPAEEA